MTSHYIDFFVTADEEIAEADLMADLFSRLHLALVRHGARDIGVSFPSHFEGIYRKIGNHLRLHGTEKALSTLMSQRWTVGLLNLQHSTVLEVPATASYRQVLRRQVKTGLDRINRRRVRRQRERGEKEVPLVMEKISQDALDLPYIKVRSQSTGHAFSLFLKHAESKVSTSTQFNMYGIGGTVPWF